MMYLLCFADHIGLRHGRPLLICSVQVNDLNTIPVTTRYMHGSRRMATSLHYE